jgi:LysM repeat protein
MWVFADCQPGFFLLCYLLLFMNKISLKIKLILAKTLMGTKGALVFLLSLFSKHLLERIGRLLTHGVFFPFYKLYLKFKPHLSTSWLQFLANQKLLLGLGLIASLILVGSESKAYGLNKYIGGRQSLLYQYLGTGGEDGDVIEEIATPVTQQPGNLEWQKGLSVPVSVGQSPIAPPTTDIISYNPEATAFMAPTIMPGISFAGRSETIKYIVRSGDTVGELAMRFQITIDTILNENKITARQPLQPGQVLTILPTSGLSHKVKKGDTLAKLAATYKVDAQKISDFNQLSDNALPVGQTLIIPDGRVPYVPVAIKPPTQTTTGKPSAIKTLDRGMLWPTASRRITQYYKWRHSALDIGLPIGNPIYASDDGVVETSGWNSGGYGYMILINHGNGIKTRYAHSSKLYVKAGERVSKGEVIALTGNTGRSTGPHLHFEIIVGGVKVNPLYYVK